jgi:hypothetical protein
MLTLERLEGSAGAVTTPASLPGGARWRRPLQLELRRGACNAAKLAAGVARVGASRGSRAPGGGGGGYRRRGSAVAAAKVDRRPSQARGAACSRKGERGSLK